MIYPPQFPIDNQNPYEEEVYNALHKQYANSGDFDVFFSRKFSGNIKGEKVEYEIDFVIADLRGQKLNGIAVIEVKGHTLNYNGSSSVWLQDGNRMNVSPTTQATQNMHSLVTRFPEIAKSVPFGWAVWFPKMTNPGKSYLPTQLTEEQYFDQICLTYTREKIEAFFDRLHQQWSNRTGADLKTYLLFKEPLIRSLGYALPLHKQIEAAEVRFIKMTNKQLELLRLIGSNNDMLVTGPAGSGKTIMATTLAREFAEQDKNTLLLTFNRTLANNIRYGLGKPENPQVSNYHSLARRFIDQYDPEWWKENSKKENFWDLEVPVKLLDVLTDHTPEYDAIVIDEAQDLKEEWFESIEKLIKPSGGFYIFMDEDQDIFGAHESIPIERRLFKFPLEENCRNTVKIIDQLKRYINKDIKYKPGAVQGQPVRIVHYSSDTDQMNKIKTEWLRLVEKEEISPDKIVIMMNANKRDSCLNRTRSFNRYRIEAVDRHGRMNRKAVNYTSINTFKGLEADVVMIIDTDKVENPNMKVLYTQVSRAKYLLYIFKKSENDIR